MSAREARRLLRFYPRAWRERYGEELEALLSELGEGTRISWGIRLDIARAGLSERFRAFGLGSTTAPGARARVGASLVLCAWMLFALAGVIVQKFSEHWQDSTPPLKRGLPAAAFHVLEVAAGVGGTLVLVGIALALPRALAYVCEGGWPHVRRALVRASVLTTAAICATAGVGVWAHQLDTAQRNGGNPEYGWAFVTCALLLAASLAAWTVLAVAIARRIRLSDRQLKIEALLTVAVGASMVAMTMATVIWWGALAKAAPWVLHGQPAGSPASSFALTLFVASVAMVFATFVAAVGSVATLGATRRPPRRAVGRRG
jgi:hypothetical protein